MKTLRLMFCFLYFFIYFIYAQDKIVLKEKAEIENDFVCLLEIIEQDQLSEDAVTLFKNIYLGRAPEIGKTRTITVEDVAEELSVRGIRTQNYIFINAKSVVERIPPTLSNAKREILLRIKLELINKNIGLRLSDINISLISIFPKIQDDDIKIASVNQKDDKLWGISSFEILLEDNRLINAVVRIYHIRSCLCATRDIPSGRRLKECDFIEKIIEVEDPTSVFTDRKQLVNALTISNIEKGEPIKMSQVRLTPVININQRVRVKGKFIEFDAISLQSGAIGEIITLRHLKDPKKLFKAKVISQDTVELNFGEQK